MKIILCFDPQCVCVMVNFSLKVQRSKYISVESNTGRINYKR